MKRILFLLLLTVSVYGQNPSRFAKIQITGNTNSGTATKVNVQEANGEVNTQTINTGFNKNIGLGGSDVVGANTLLNQYSTTPVDWTATAFNSGQVVFYGGKQWIAKMATVAGDVPSVSSKWEEITFEALANKTVTVDQTIIDGSTNAVSGNAVFDALATKAPLASPSLTGTPTAPTAPAGTNTTQIATTAFVQAGLNLKSNLSDITLQRAYDTSTDKKIQTLAIRPFTLKAQTAAASDNVFVIENSSGFEVASVGAQGKLSAISASVEGNVTGNFFIKRSAPANNILLAGGGDIAQSTFALASSAHNPVTLGTANGLSLSNQVLNLGLASSSVTGALSGTDWNTFNSKFNTPTGLTTNFLPKWNGSGFGNSSVFDNGTNIGIGTTNPTANLTVKGAYSVGSSIPTNWALLSAGRMGVAKNNKGLYFDIFNDYAEVSTYDWSLGQAYPMVFQGNGGNSMFGTNVDNGSKVQVNGTISASPATTANQVPTWGQVQAAARPYKVYTAVLKQQNTNEPTAVVLENTLGGTVVWTRNSTGNYYGTLNNAFPIQNKIAVFQGGSMWGTFPLKIIRVQHLNSNTIQIFTQQATDGALVDSSLSETSIEIRVYN